MKKLSFNQIFAAWWPLAASWLFMGMELPLISAVMARLPDEEIHLAAYSGVVFPIALIIEAPIIMLLAASVALSKDWASYAKVRRFMMWAGFILTAIHFLIAFTPLYDPVVVGLMGVTPEIVEPSRIGLMIMLPWTWTIAYRRFNQGVLIRYGQSGAVGVGTALRLVANAGALTLGWLIGGLPGIAVGTMGIAAGVTAEAIYAGIRVRPLLRELKAAPAVSPALTWREFSAFYTPLAVTSLLNLIVQPMATAAISRMPRDLESLAVLGPLMGLIFMFRSLGFAYNEVVIKFFDEQGGIPAMRNFALMLSCIATGVMLLAAVSPLSGWLMESLFDLSPELQTLGRTGLLLALPWPAISILLNYYQGLIVAGKRTRAVTHSIIAFMAATGILLAAGAAIGSITGLYVGFVAFQAGYAVQTIWLWRRSATFIRENEVLMTARYERPVFDRPPAD
jgi:hypothetical protein